MHILSFSLDPLVLDPKSVVARRSSKYGDILDSYTILVPTQKDTTVVLSEKVTVIGVSGSNKLIQYGKFAQTAQKIIRSRQTDIITSQDVYFLGFLGYCLARLYHLGLEIQVHGIEKLNWFRRFVLLFVLRHASAVRVVSKRVCMRLEKEHNFTPNRVTVAPIYVDVSSLNFDHASFEATKAAKAFNDTYSRYLNFVTISRLVPEKNIALQLKAVNTLRKKYPDIRLHIVGGGPLRDKLAEQIAEFDLSSHVVMHGAQYKAQLHPFFTQTDCLLLTSHSEGWGMVVIEAACAGLPVIMTDVGCAGEVIHNGENGYIINDNDLSGLVQAMETIILDENKRQQFGSRSVEIAKTLPSFEETLKMYQISWQLAFDNRL